MGERTSVDSAVSVGIAAVGGIQLFRLYRRLRHRASDPNMEDPGRNLVLRMKLAVAAIGVLAVMVIVGLFAWLGPVAIIFAVVVVVVAILASLVFGAWLWLVAERRRRALRYVICEDDYADAPRQIKSTMRRIYKSAKSVQSSEATQRDMFGDLSVDEVVYSAAERAIMSSELAAGARDLRPDSAPSDQLLLREADDQIRAIKEELATVEAAFKRGAAAVDKLSKRITEPERERAAEQARQASASAVSERSGLARAHLEDVSRRAKAGSVADFDSAIDRIESVAAGYDDVRQISDRVLNGPSEAVEVESTASSTTQDALGKAARFTASATKWSAATAKSSAKKFSK